MCGGEGGEALKAFQRAGRPSHCHEEQCPRMAYSRKNFSRSHPVLQPCSKNRHRKKETGEKEEEEEIRAGQHASVSSRLDEIFTTSIEINFSEAQHTDIQLTGTDLLHTHTCRAEK